MKKKYFIRKKTFLFIGIIIIISVFLYLSCLIIEYQNNNLYGTKLIKISSIFKDFLLVFISVFITALISSVLIEVNSRNNIFYDTVRDFLQDDNFYFGMSEDDQKMFSNNLDSRLFFDNNKVLSEMCQSVKENLSTISDKQYYFQKHNLIIRCKIDVSNNRIIKEITDITYLRSYDKNCTLNNYPLTYYICDRSTNTNFGIDENSFKITIDGNKLDEEQYKIINDYPKDTIEKKSGYNLKTIYELNEPLILSFNEDRKLEISYTSIVDINDTIFATRMPVPCKETFFQFNLEPPEQGNINYKLVTLGFGFINSASDSPNNVESSTNVNLAFNDWLFPEDGWIVEIQKVQTYSSSEE